MVWAAYSYDAKLPLAFWRGNERVNAHSYSERVLGDVVHPWLDANDKTRMQHCCACTENVA